MISWWTKISHNKILLCDSAQWEWKSKSKLILQMKINISYTLSSQSKEAHSPWWKIGSMRWKCSYTGWATHFSTYNLSHNRIRCTSCNTWNEIKEVIKTNSEKWLISDIIPSISTTLGMWNFLRVIKGFEIFIVALHITSKSLCHISPIT